MSALAFSPDGLKLAAGDVSTFLIYILICPQLLPQNQKKKKLAPACVDLTPCVYVVVWLADTRTHAEFFTVLLSLIKLSKKKKVKRKSHPLRRREARSDHLPLDLPFGARKLVKLDRGLATLRLWCARYAHIRLERPEAHQEHSDQERSGRGGQCRPLVVRRQPGQRERQVGGDGGGRKYQGVAGQVPRVRRSMKRPKCGVHCFRQRRCPKPGIDSLQTQRAADRSTQSELTCRRNHLSFFFQPISFSCGAQKPRTLNTAMRKLSVTMRHVYRAEKDREKWKQK